MPENLRHDVGVGDERQDAPATTAFAAAKDVDGEDTRQKRAVLDDLIEDGSFGLPASVGSRGATRHLARYREPVSFGRAGAVAGHVPDRESHNPCLTVRDRDVTHLGPGRAGGTATPTSATLTGPGTTAIQATVSCSDRTVTITPNKRLPGRRLRRRHAARAAALHKEGHGG